MNHLLISITALALIQLCFAVASPQAAETSLLPESLAARSEIAPVEKTFTIFLKEDDPEKLTQLLNASNEEYAKKGWSVFTINTYSDNGDVDGFFVTYSKGLKAE
ncbi:hypothetical protein LA52FAK_24040 [Desulforhopalus sp. 52FAK]